MYLSNSHLKGHFMRSVLLAVLFIMIFASLSAAAERRLGAVAATQARSQASGQAAANLGAGGPGSDLARISSGPRTQQSFTGFPTGTLPGDGGDGGGSVEPAVRVAMSGDPLSPVIGPEMVGSTLDRLAVIASHVGYTIARVGYSPTVMDMPYTFALMNGNRKVSTLYFNRSMILVMIQ